MRKLIKLTKKNTKVFTGLVRTALKQCLDEGYLPAYPEEIRSAIKAGVLKKDWFDTGVIYYPETGKLLFGERKDFEKLLASGEGRLAFLNYYNDDLVGNLSIYNNGRFAGVNMICPHCSKETEQVEERVFEGLTVRPIEQIGVAFKDIVIPEGWRIPTLEEGISLVNNPEFVQWSRFDDGNHDFYVEQPFNKSKRGYASWLGCGGDGFNIVTSNFLDGGSAARGCIFIKDKED